MTDAAPLGILMLQGKMADVPGCMASEATWPYPVRRMIVEGATTPRTQEDAEALLPLYVDAARELAKEGVKVITANCGLMALVQPQVAAAVRVPVVLSSLVAVPTVARMIAPGRRIGVLTFFTDAVGERNFNACGWSSEDFPVSVAGVGECKSWLKFLETKEVDADLHETMREDLRQVIHEFLSREPDIGALVSECTMLPAVLDELRPDLPVPLFDILTVLDWAVYSGFGRLGGKVATGVG
ncbi:MAG TPA: aspartate/glutamate racemase family protein [Pseudonocardiaceae bacterium]|nr:aspartate/glutamate racemase family protein [Pseudonocardiaceae bacterium]